MDAVDCILAYCREHDIDCVLVLAGGGSYVVKIEDKMYLVKPYSGGAQ